MVRSVCFISREYPPDTAFGGIARSTEMMALALANEGLSVHVVALQPAGAEVRRGIQDGVLVHRVPVPASPIGDCPDIDELLWATYVADYVRRLDAAVNFDIVVAPDYFAESAKLELASRSALIVQLHGGRSVIRDPEEMPPSEAIAAALELYAIERADHVFAGSRLIAERTAAHIPGLEATVLPPPFDLDRVKTPAVARGPHEIELVFVGRYEPLKRPELAIAALGELVRRGRDAHLTLVGRDTTLGPNGASYRRSVLIPAMHEAGVNFGHVRFLNEVAYEEVHRHFAHAHVAVLPSRFESLGFAAIEALAIGTPVIAGAAFGLSDWVAPTEGLVAVPTEDPAAFAEIAADVISESNFLASGVAGTEAVRRTFDPRSAARTYIEYFDSLLDTPARRTTVARATSPTLGIIMLAHNALAYTQRAVRSIVHHTTVPFELVIVDNASTDETGAWLRTLDDERVHVVSSATNVGVSGGRNLGIAALSGNEDFVVFLDNDTEVITEWWDPFLRILAVNEEIGIVGENGARAEWYADRRHIVEAVLHQAKIVDIAVGFCMFMRPEVIRTVGGFDEHLGLFWHDDDDYAMRARRLGWHIVAAGSGRVIHFEHRSSKEVDGIWIGSEPSEMSTKNQEYLARKHARLISHADSPFVAVADATEAAENPLLLQTWGSIFSAADDAKLVLYGPGLDPEAFIARLTETAQLAGFDLETGPRIVAELQPIRDEITEQRIADEAHVYAALERPDGPFAHLAVVAPDDHEALREMALRSWRARPSARVA